VSDGGLSKGLSRGDGRTGRQHPGCAVSHEVPTVYISHGPASHGFEFTQGPHFSTAAGVRTRFGHAWTTSDWR